MVWGDTATYAEDSGRQNSVEGNPRIEDGSRVKPRLSARTGLVYPTATKYE